MNKIYKVIWSKVRNCYVCVSEVAKTTMRLPAPREAQWVVRKERLVYV